MIVDSKKMALIDKKTIETSVSGETLMENAGRLTAHEIMNRYAFDEVFVCAGPGNNGGDGYVISRYLIENKFKVTTLVLCSPEKIRGDAEKNYEKLKKLCATRKNFKKSEKVDGAGKNSEKLSKTYPVEKNSEKLNKADDTDQNAKKLNKADGIFHVNTLDEIKNLIPDNRDSHRIFVDAIFGTGLKRKTEGLYEDAIKFINSQSAVRVSVDIPSGISGDDGKKLGEAVKADMTVTFGLPKFGQYIHPGRSFTGDIVVADIGIPEKIIEGFSIEDRLLTEQILKQKIVRRKPDTHKNTYGHTVVISGSVGKVGASKLVCRGALKAGAGLVTLLVPETIYVPAADSTPEVMVEPLAAKNGSASFDSFRAVFETLKNISVVAFGPGVGINGETEKILLYLLEKDVPLVIDADGLRLLKPHLEKLKNSNVARILTPHRGEFAFLIDSETGEVREKRLLMSKEFAVKFKAHLLLKGNDSVIVTPKGNVSLNTTGNPGMANAGQGDALTGFISGILSSGYDPRTSMELGVFLHGLSGDMLEEGNGPVGILASDVIDNFPAAWNALAVYTNKPASM